MCVFKIFKNTQKELSTGVHHLEEYTQDDVNYCLQRAHLPPYFPQEIVPSDKVTAKTVKRLEKKREGNFSIGGRVASRRARAQLISL